MKPLIILLFCHALAVQLSAATTLGVREPTPNASTAAQVPVELSTTTAAVAMQADVLFDASKFNVSDAEEGAQPDGVQVQSRLMEPGRLRVVVHHRSSGALGSDVVFQVPLTAKTGVVSDDPIVLTDFIISGQGGGALTTTLLPRVRLVNLRDGQNLNGRLGIELSATASATAGTISKVEYYVGGVKVGEGAGANFSFLWQPTISGPFEITAVAYDSNGQQASTRTIPVIVTHVGTFAGAVLGSYFGLVRGPQFSFANDGYVTMTSTTTGKFTLKLLTGGKTWSASGQFDGTGNATAKIVRGKGIKDLTIVLAHSSTPPVDQIHGRVADGTFAAGKFSGNTFETEFTVDRVVWKLKTREAPQNGAYTMLLPSHDDAATLNAPLGTGYGTVTVGKDGRAKLAGSLADGTTVTASSFLSKDGVWPVYASLQKGKGVLMSQITFAQVPEVSDFEGTLTWFRAPDLKATRFKSGFLTELDLVGSRYTKPAAHTRLIPLANVAGNSLLYLDEGGLTTDLVRLATWSSGNKIQIPMQEADQSKLAINTKNGVLSGSFIHPFTQKTVALKGAVLQAQDLVGGYFSAGLLGGDLRLAKNPALPPGPDDGGPQGIGTTLPTVKIASPVSGTTLKTITAGILPIKGSAYDKQGIASVRVQVLHDGVLTEPDSAAGTISWDYNLQIPEGQGGLYTVFAKSIDTLGDESEVVSTRFWVPLKANLSVAVTGPGSVSKGFLGTTSRDVGKLISITATPAKKKRFLGWSGSVTSSSTTIKVLMKPDTTLTANFGD